MARTGNFGRSPRAAPSLTSTLIAIAREQEQRRDQNMMEAWQRGGMFEGRQVTDAVILQHWQGRLKDISPQDPLYDTYKNAVTQYEYAIAESKMTAQYAMNSDPKAGDDAAMAAFYLNWAKRIPRGGEFYRVLQRDAGQYLRSARAKREAGARQRKEEAYQRAMLAIEAQEEAPGQNALHVITMLAQYGVGNQGAVLGRAAQGDPRNSMQATNIGALELPSVAQMMMLLNAVTLEGVGGEYEPRHLGAGNPAEVAGRGNPAVLYYDEAGAPVTGIDLHAMFQKADPDWNGNFNVPYVQGLIAQWKAGIQKQVKVAKKAGHVNEAMNLQQSLAKVNEYGHQFTAWPVLKTYREYKQDLDDVMKNDGLMPGAKLAAIDRINMYIGALANDPSIATDAHLRSQLTGEAKGTPGTVTVNEDMTGRAHGYTTAQNSGVSEVMNIQDIRKQLADDQALLLDPTSGYVLTQGNYVKTADGGKMFEPAAGAQSIGITTTAQLAAVQGAGPAVTVMVPNGDGSGFTPMVVVPSPVYAKATRADGSPVDLVDKNPVATFIRWNVNGVEVTLYSITDRATKQTRWTVDPPWAGQPWVKQTNLSNGSIMLDLTGVVQTLTAPEVGKDQNYGNGFEVRGSRAAGPPHSDPSSRYGRTEPKAGALVMDARAAVFATSPERGAAGVDPNTDSFSPTLISLKLTADGSLLLKKWFNDPAFRAVLDRDARVASGFTMDDAGEWVGGDAKSYAENQINARIEMSKTAAPHPHDPRGESVAWQREHTNTQMDGSIVVPVTPGPLPANALLGHGPSNRFEALSDAFSGNSNNFKPAAAWGGPARTHIDAGFNLTVPGLANIPPPTGDSGRPRSGVPVAYGGNYPGGLWPARPPFAEQSDASAAKNTEAAVWGQVMAERAALEEFLEQHGGPGRPADVAGEHRAILARVRAAEGAWERYARQQQSTARGNLNPRGTIYGSSPVTPRDLTNGPATSRGRRDNY
ncbi:MAG: hypothetical protein EXR69_12555 [Myxococcales bacterium]|nr:hypothetical protein [Myxococcales bacterium]